MAPTTLRIRKFSLKKDQLAKLPSAERDLFFLSGHILNELNSLNKVFGWCLRSAGVKFTRFRGRLAARNPSGFRCCNCVHDHG
jgi:hypothetical protein